MIINKNNYNVQIDWVETQAINAMIYIYRKMVLMPHILTVRTRCPSTVI